MPEQGILLGKRVTPTAAQSRKLVRDAEQLTEILQR
jgi:hypothetical protein